MDSWLLLAPVPTKGVTKEGHEYASEAVARKGRLVRWWIWLALFPLTAALYVASAISNGSGTAAPPPRRLIFHAKGHAVIDYRPRKNRYLNPSPTLDPRLVAALILIHSRATLDT